MSFAMEVVADSSGKFAGNSCRYATFLEANHAGSELMSRWMAVREYRVVESEDPVNYRFNDATWRNEPIAVGCKCGHGVEDHEKMGPCNVKTASEHCICYQYESLSQG